MSLLYNRLLAEQKKLNGNLIKNGHPVLVAQILDAERTDQPEIIARYNFEETRCQTNLRHVNEALDRFAAGVYGICVDCGHYIPLDRLDAIPTASRCKSCQEKHKER